MKKYINILFAAALTLSLTACQNFLTRDSLTSMDDGMYWRSENNVRLYVNGAYGNYFSGYSDNWGQVNAPGVYSAGEYSDDHTSTGVQRNILLSVPADNWYRAETTPYRGVWLARRAGSAWNFAYVRKWNLLINRLETMKEGGYLTDSEYNHWMGVARFLRGWEYSRLVYTFGDVPYYDAVIAPDDLDTQFKARDPRSMVMNKVLDDFKFAIENVRENDGQNYINKYVVGTIASRCMLFEGTWYVYHKNDEAMKTCSDIDANAKKFLEAARDFAAVVIDSGKFAFDTDFRTLFGTLYTTPASKEIILYREYNKSVNTSAQHCIASYSGGNGGYESQITSGNLSTLKAWICNDGQPYSKTNVAGADSWRMQDMVKTRDPRFEASFVDEPVLSGATGLYSEKFIDRDGVKYAYNGETCPPCYASDTNENGYPCVRYAETVLNWIEAKAELADHFGGTAVTQADLDKSINAIRERPLDKTAIDKGVKKTAHLQLSNLPDDPERLGDPIKTTLGYKTAGATSKLLWEIRRERRMEFFLEQYRAKDIRRWGQLELMLIANNPDLGVGGWVELDLAATLTAEQAADLPGNRHAQETNLKKTKANVGYNLLTAANFGVVAVYPIANTNADGTIKLGEAQFWSNNVGDASVMRGFLRPQKIADRDARNVDVRNYLEPICTDVINQYAEKGYTIKQNPGW
jgi:hypothetical protein